MKRFRAVLAMILIISMIVSIAAITAAEAPIEAEWQADILKLMDEAYAPKTTTINYDYSVPEGMETQSRVHTVEKINGDGATMQAKISMLAMGMNLTEEDWTSIGDWLGELVNGALARAEVNSEAMAQAIAEACASAKRAAGPDENGNIPVWANENLVITSIEVTVPYYPELSNGVNGSATQQLQETLILLGYLDDDADGYFGGKTQAAVEELERYIRELEQDVIDARPTPEPTEQPVVTPVPDAADENEMDRPMDVPLTDPTATPAAEPQPTPVTPVDGVADALLQAYLYSDSFKITRSELKSGDSGDAVTRLQRRLIQLGYMVGTADGIYGGTTARSVRIFQYYNGLEQTGVADVALQELLFSESAVAPDNAMLAFGSAGDAVRELQRRLRVLGFTSASVDGDFGKSTQTAVETLQSYMREMEEEAIRSSLESAQSESDDGSVVAAAVSDQEIEAMLTIEVNGIADPMLLEDFYSDAFPAVPETMNSGASGRDVVRLQRRLSALEYYFSSLDGSYGSGTASAVKAFQKRHGLEQTGVADQATLALLFSEDAQKALKPYVLKISTDDQRVYAYGLDSNNEYTVLVRTMKCSTGKNETPTPKGTFQNGTGPGARWHYFKKYKCWAQYAYYIDGDIMFHSVLYNEKDGPVTQSSVNNLGRKASHGCVRLSVEDAKWIYQNCPRNTKIIVY